jgi:hypothetical protein
VKTQRKRDWLDDLFDYEVEHPIAFASPRALMEARLIAVMDQGRRRPSAQAAGKNGHTRRRSGTAPRRKNGTD